MYVKKADEIKKEIVEVADKTEIQWLIGEDTADEKGEGSGYRGLYKNIYQMQF